MLFEFAVVAVLFEVAVVALLLKVAVLRLLFTHQVQQKHLVEFSNIFGSWEHFCFSAFIMVMFGPHKQVPCLLFSIEKEGIFPHTFN